MPLTMLIISVLGVALVLFIFFPEIPNSAKSGIKIFVAVVVVFAVLLTFFVNKAFGDDKWFYGAYIDAGIGNSYNLSPVCEPTSKNNKLYSDGRFGLHVYKNRQSNKEFAIDLDLLHHNSCAVGIDSQTNDGAVLRFNYSVEWR